MSDMDGSQNPLGTGGSWGGALDTGNETSSFIMALMVRLPAADNITPCDIKETRLPQVGTVIFLVLARLR